MRQPALVLAFAVCASCAPKSTAPSSFASAIIFGQDDRQDIYTTNDPVLANNYDATASLWPASKILINPFTGGYDLPVGPFWVTHGVGICPGEPFANQPVGAKCSAVLINPTQVATAGHCVLDSSGDSYVIAFNFRMIDPNTVESEVTANDLYSVTKIAAVWGGASDYAVLTLDRPVTNHAIPRLASAPPTPGTPLYMFGHPDGMPIKWTPNGAVLNVSATAFTNSLDTFRGNSGAGVFNALTGELVGIQVSENVDPTLYSKENVDYSLTTVNGQYCYTRSMLPWPMASAFATAQLISQFLPAPPPPPATGVTLTVDTVPVSSPTLSGFAQDLAAPSAALSVQIYVDGALAATVAANQPHADPAGGTSNHGFSWTVPSGYDPSVPHAIKIVALNAAGQPGATVTPPLDNGGNAPPATPTDATSYVSAAITTNPVPGLTVGSYSGMPYRRTTFAMDTNGDGKADVVWIDPAGTLETMISNGRTFRWGASTATSFSSAAGWNGDARFFPLDVDGDHRADLVARAADGTLYVMHSDGALFHQTASVASPFSDAAYGSGSSLFAMDVNGDGRGDLVGRDANGTFTFLISNGSGFTSAATQSTAMTDAAGFGALNRLMVLDVNGDHKDDLVQRAADGTLCVLYSLGTSFHDAGNCTHSALTDAAGWATPPAGAPTASRLYRVDVNQDGFGDLLARNSDGSFELFVSSGVGLDHLARGNGSGDHYFESRFNADNPNSLFVGDFDGDGQGGFLVSSWNSNSPQQAIFDLHKLQWFPLFTDGFDPGPNTAWTTPSGVAPSTYVPFGGSRKLLLSGGAGGSANPGSVELIGIASAANWRDYSARAQIFLPDTSSWAQLDTRISSGGYDSLRVTTTTWVASTTWGGTTRTVASGSLAGIAPNQPFVLDLDARGGNVSAGIGVGTDLFILAKFPTGQLPGQGHIRISGFSTAAPGVLVDNVRVQPEVGSTDDEFTGAPAVPFYIVGAVDGPSVVRVNDYFRVSGWLADTMYGMPLINTTARALLNGNNVGTIYLGKATPSGPADGRANYPHSGVDGYGYAGATVGTFPMTISGYDFNWNQWISLATRPLQVVGQPTIALELVQNTATGSTAVPPGGGAVRFKGYVIDPFPGGTVKTQVCIEMDSASLGCLAPSAMHLYRPDVAGGNPDYYYSGFDTTITVPPGGAGDHTLQVFVQLFDNNNQSIFNSPIKLHYGHCATHADCGSASLECLNAGTIATFDCASMNGNIDVADNALTGGTAFPANLCSNCAWSATTLRIAGWVVDPDWGQTASITGVTAYVDGSLIGSLGGAQLHLARQDVANAFNRSDYLYSGYDGQLSLPSWMATATGSHTITVQAQSADGAVYQIGARAITVGQCGTSVDCAVGYTCWTVGAGADFMCHTNGCTGNGCHGGCCDATGTCVGGTAAGACGGSGGSCTVCPSNDACTNQQCVCVPYCGGACNVGNGCGGTCTCLSGYTCSANTCIRQCPSGTRDCGDGRCYSTKYQCP